jgi:hypothetical protein
MPFRRSLFAAVVIATAPIAAPAQTQLFFDNLNSAAGGSNYTVNYSSAAAGYGAATFGFNYSTLGIPAAPRTTDGSTLGLKLEANKIVGSGVVGGTSVSPLTSPIPSGLTTYTVRFDLWMNSNGPFPVGGGGSTQHAGVSIGTTGSTHEFPGVGGGTGGVVSGATFLADGDGGVSATSATVRDYTGYLAPNTMLTTGYAATGTDAQYHGNAYYANFGGVAPPAAQTALSANQSGQVAVGAQGFEWHTWTITRQDNTVQWFIRDRNGTDVLIQTVDISGKPFAGTNIALNQMDFFASVAPTTDQPYLFGLFDNVEIFTPVPEPATIGLVGLIIPAGYALRRRTRRGAA